MKHTLGHTHKRSDWDAKTRTELNYELAKQLNNEQTSLSNRTRFTELDYQQTQNDSNKLTAA